MEIFFKYHINHYKKMQNQDKIKLLYQACYGPFHFSSELNEKKVFKRSLDEQKHIKNKKNIYYEYISDKYVRVFLDNEINLKYLVKAFISSSKDAFNNENLLKENLKKYLKDEEYFNYDFIAVSHSSIYKEEYDPHYLLINTKYLTYMMRAYQLSLFLNSAKNHEIIALEGKCGSGKTTLAENFKDDYTILEADDFFLSSEKRSESRLNEVGGNIDYELAKEALEKIKKAWLDNKDKVVIKVYSCKDDKYYEKELSLKNKVLFEGVYSYHPYFRSLISKCAFLYVDEKVQFERISLRWNSDMFFKKWIPLENKYFDSLDILSISDIII